MQSYNILLYQFGISLKFSNTSGAVRIDIDSSVISLTEWVKTWITNLLLQSDSLGHRFDYFQVQW